MFDNIPILTLREIKEFLKDKKLPLICDATGLTFPTVKKLYDGKKTNYELETLQKISKYIRDYK